MKLKSFFKRFFLGNEVIEKINSPINGEIAVVEDLFGRKEMRIGRVTQSGGLVEKLWEQIFNFSPPLAGSRLKAGKFLILGLGCGTLAKLINERWPEAKITGVEIDPEVVKIGKKYFGLDKIDNLEIEITDAISIIHSSKFIIQSYDLIIVDLYLGQNFPKEAESEEFLSGLKKILNKNGLVIFNRLYYNQEFQKSANEFLKELKNIFSSIKTKRAITNLLIFGQKDT